MVSNLGDSCNCILLDDTELNNFLFYAQARSQVGIAALDNSPSSTTSGERTSTDTRQHCTELDDDNQSGDDIDEVHQCISNYFNSTYSGTDEDNKGQVGGVNNYDEESYNEENFDEENEDNWEYDNDDKIKIAYMKGKAKGHRKGKGKGKKGDNGKGKDAKTTVTCYTCGRQGHTSTTIQKAKMGKDRTKATSNNPTTNTKQKCQYPAI
eukprot:879368-Amphidinium_carterae.2